MGKADLGGSRNIAPKQQREVLAEEVADVTKEGMVAAWKAEGPSRFNPQRLLLKKVDGDEKVLSLRSDFEVVGQETVLTSGPPTSSKQRH